MALVYQHIREDKEEVFYIGISNNKVRPYSKSRNAIWKKITNKTSYRVEIIYDNISWEEALLIEVELIAKYGRIDLKNGCLSNMTDGGDGTHGIVGFWTGKKQPKEMIEKRIANSVGRKRPKQSNSMKGLLTGEKNGMFGKKCPEQSVRMAGANNPSWKGYIEAYDKKTKELIGTFISTKEAGKELNVCHQSINAIVLGKTCRKSAGGYTFIRVVDIKDT
jgi:hypothetical protein